MQVAHIPTVPALVELDHADLGPSAASRWLPCTPSMRASKGYPDESTDAAKEGTLAHDISEIMIKDRLGMITKQKAAFMLMPLQQNPMYNAEMQEFCKAYMEYVLRYWSIALTLCPKPVILIESKFSLRRWIPESFGKTDVTILAGEWLFVLDFKYGQGVLVEIKGNKQTRLYAMGALDAFKDQYPIKHVEMHIFQPRMKNIGKDYISAYDLWDWAETYVKPRAEKAWQGLGDYVAGPHCNFCKAKPRCRTASEYARTPAGHAHFEDPNTLTDRELVEIALTLPLLMSYAKGVGEYMQRKALAGKKWPDMKLVEGRSNRKITNEQLAIWLLESHGYKDVTKTSIKGFGELEAMIGDLRLEEILGSVIEKPKGYPTLVAATDARPEYVAMNALDFFKDNLKLTQ